MNQKEMLESFLAQIHNFDVDAEYEFQTHEINIFLTKAYRQVVDELYSQFEKTEKARKLLAKLIWTESVAVSANTTYFNGYKAVLTGVSPAILYMLSEEAIFSRDVNNGVMIKPITLDAYNANTDNPFKKPYKNLVWRLDVGNGIDQVVLIASENVAQYNFTYLAQPEEVDVTLTTSLYINEEAHNEIVNKAVQLALQAKQINNNLKNK
jgi:hypothetical protein